MKKLTLISAIILSSNIVNAQITLEQVYQNAFDLNIDFGIVNLGDSTYKYYLVDLNNSEFTLYNLNHSVYLPTVQIPETWNNYNYNIQYITNSLFDCDSTNVEYVLRHNQPYYVKVYRDDGTMLFFSDSAQAVNCFGCATVYRTYINNTPDGTKMILGYSDSTVNVYSLCGSLPTGYYKLLNETEMNFAMSNPYPNPFRDYTRIDYQLPKGVYEGEIVFYNIQGREIKKFKVDRTFDHLRIATSDLHSGTYFYSLKTTQGIIGGKKMIKIK